MLLTWHQFAVLHRSTSDNPIARHISCLTGRHRSEDCDHPQSGMDKGCHLSCIHAAYHQSLLSSQGLGPVGSRFDSFLVGTQVQVGEEIGQSVTAEFVAWMHGVGIMGRGLVEVAHTPPRIPAVRP